MKLVFVGGAQGAGKSTLVAQAAEELRRSGFSVFHLDPGEELRAYCKRKNLGSWHSMPAERKLKINRAVLKEIRPKLTGHDLVLVSTHFAARFNPLDRDSLDDVPLNAPLSKPFAKIAKHLVLLDSDPEEVYRRVNQSIKERYCEWEDVSRSVIANRISAHAFATENNIPLTVLHNRRDLEKETIGELVKIGRSLVKE